MDFDRYLTSVQTFLRSTERRLKIKLVDVTRENNEEMCTVVQSFSEFLKELDPGADNLRKINLYLLINSEFDSVLLQSDINFCHLLNTIPKLSTVLYFELMNNTDLYHYIGEVIMFCPEVLAVDILKCISSNIRYARAETVIPLLDLIYEGLYQKILSLQEQSDTENVRQKFVKIFQSLFEFSIFEIIEKISWKLETRQCFFGRYIKTILNLLEKCINLFKNKCLCDKMEFYTIEIEYDYKRWPLQAKEDNWPVYCLQIMICKCKKVLKEINVDIYMAWCEENDEEEIDKTLQMAVREAAYMCREALNTIMVYEEKIVDLSFLITGLNNIAVRPKTEDDEFDQANTETIARNMKDPEKTRIKWLKAYLNINNIFLENRCVDDLKSVTKIFTKETTLQLIGTFIKHLTCGEIPEKSIESFKEIISNSVRNLKLEEQLEILNTVASKGSNTLKSANFNNNVTETFNKLVNRSDKMEKVMQNAIILALESGKELVTLLIADCLKGTNLCNLLIQILLNIPVLTKFTVSSTDSTPLCLQCVVQHFNEAVQNDLEERDNLKHMIKNLSSHSLINGKGFIVNYLIPTIETSVPAKKWKVVDLCLDIFGIFVDGSAGAHVQVCEAEIIAFLAQLLNRSRLQPPQFTSHSAQVVQKANFYLFTLTNSFLIMKNDTTEKEACWLRDVAKTMSPLTWFPMRKLWTISGLQYPRDPNNLLAWTKQYLGREDLLNMNEDARSSFVIQLCKVLPLLCQSEWAMIGYQMGGSEKAAQCVAVYHILADCLLVLNQLPVVIGNPVCVAHLVSGFTSFFKVKAVHALTYSHRDTCLDVLNKQVILINELSPEVLKIRLPALVTVLQDMLAIIIEKGKDRQNSDLLATVASVKEPQIQSILSKRLVKSLSG